MLRRWIAAGLVGIGGLLLWRLWPPGSVVDRRMYAPAIVAAAGTAIACTSIVRRRLALRPWLRNLCGALALLLLAGVLALQYHLEHRVAPQVPAGEVGYRRVLLEWCSLLRQMSLAVGYAAASVFLLPATHAPRPGATSMETEHARNSV